MGKVGRILLKGLPWVATAFLGLVMILVGWGKVSGTPPWPRFFTEFGFPDWFRVVVGLGQISGAILMFVPRTARYGAGLLAIIMAGAVITELTREGGFPSPRTAIVYLVVLLGIFAVRTVEARGRAVGVKHASLS